MLCVSVLYVFSFLCVCHYFVTYAACYRPPSLCCSINLTWLELIAARPVRRVEPMHFGCVELVEQHGSTCSSRRARLARHVERVVSRRDEPSGIWALSRALQFLPDVHELLHQLTQDCENFAKWTKLVAPDVESNLNEYQTFAVAICRQLSMAVKSWTTRLNDYAMERSRHEANVRMIIQKLKLVICRDPWPMWPIRQLTRDPLPITNGHYSILSKTWDEKGAWHGGTLSRQPSCRPWQQKIVDTH